jgi:hypothetical protein
MLLMSASSPAPPVRRLVLVPAATTSSRGDELVRRYRLARLRLAGREAQAAERAFGVKSSAGRPDLRSDRDGRHPAGP